MIPDHLRLIEGGAPEAASVDAASAGAAAVVPPTASEAMAAPVLRGADRAVLASLKAALEDAREHGDERPPFTIIAGCLDEFGVALPQRRMAGASIEQARDDWLRRLRSANRSKSTLDAYRVALDDLISFLGRTNCAGARLSEETIVCYLTDYRRRTQPAEATYHRRFTLLRHFFEWYSRRSGEPDPFLDLDPPPKPRQEANWLTAKEFDRLLVAAGSPQRNRPGLAERDRLVLLTLVVTGLRRSELLALNWGDLDLDDEHPSLLVRAGKGGKPRRQPLPAALAQEFRRRQAARSPAADAPVFCGLAGRRLTPTILAAVIRRAAERARIGKRVTAHTLRHTAATWLRQQTGDPRLVAEYLGHADLSTVSRYTHVAAPELHAAAETIAACGGLAQALQAAWKAALRDAITQARPAEGDALRAADRAGTLKCAVRREAGTARKANGRAPAPSGSKKSPRHAVTATRTRTPARDL